MLNSLKKAYKNLLSQIGSPYLEKIFAEGFPEHLKTGISGCYLAASPYCQKFITIEGSSSLAKIAESNLNQMSNSFVLFSTLFDSALDQILPNLTQTIDVAYIDGNHEKRATLNYLERLKPHLSQNGIVLFDDIHWTTDMEEAWQIISQCQGFSYTINLGRIGLGIWDSNTAHTKTYSLATYTDYWQRGKPKTYQNNLKSVVSK